MYHKLIETIYNSIKSKDFRFRGTVTLAFFADYGYKKLG